MRIGTHVGHGLLETDKDAVTRLDIVGARRADSLAYNNINIRLDEKTRKTYARHQR
jgi:hypothetical protein